MKLNKRAAVIAIAASIPFIALASYSWITAATDKSFPAYEADHFGDQIYALGSPLTLVVLGLPYYAGTSLNHRHDWLWIPLVGSLFVLQWIIWSQLIANLLQWLNPRAGLTTNPRSSV
jgi:hypothetical protein